MREPVVALLRAGYRARGRKAADAPAFSVRTERGAQKTAERYGQQGKAERITE